MELVRRFVGFWYDFIVGDDWLIAVGVLAALAVAAVLAHSAWEAVAWVFLPVAVVAVLYASLARAVRRR
jgi:membrane protein implicated in regulation of membrane protease activity